MNNKLGIMQGRLSPRFDGQYQSHPILHWQSEFFIAKELGLQLVEFILDLSSLKFNPLLSVDGRSQIKKIAELSGVGVNSICADVFMDHTFASAKKTHDPSKAIYLLNQTIESAEQLNIRDVVIPCVDRSSLPCEDSQAQFITCISALCADAANRGICINLEADWEPHTFGKILDAIGRDKVWVNYDTGNSSALGFDPREEFAIYGNSISDLHIKDRPFGQSSVTLGTGDADFEYIISWLKTNKFAGQMIFQAARGEHFVDDLALVRSQVEWFKQKWLGNENEQK